MYFIKYNKNNYDYGYKFKFVFQVYLAHIEDNNDIEITKETIGLIYDWYKIRLQESYELIKIFIGQFTYKLSKIDDKIIIEGLINKNKENLYFVKEYLVEIDIDNNYPINIFDNDYSVVPYNIIEQSYMKINNYKKFLK